MQAIVQRAKHGEGEAVESLFETLLPYISRTVDSSLGRHLQARVDPTDVVQSVCLSVLRDLRQVRSDDIRSLRCWIGHVVRNEIHRQAAFHTAKKRDMRRDSEVDCDGVPDDRDHSPLGMTIARETREELRRAVDALDIEYRQVIFYRYILDLPWAEVGSRMGRSEPAAKMLCQRAFAKLRDVYGRAA